MAEQAQQDLSSFMSVLIMTIGCLTILLVANTLIIASNPENVQITSLVTTGGAEGSGGVPYFANKSMVPTYVDVRRDSLIILPEGEIVLSGDLERQDNALQKLLQRVEDRKDREYVVLILRPYSATFSRRLKKLIKNRGIQIGQELYEEGRAIQLQRGEDEFTVEE